ncbi:MAG: hypothetical protein A2X79_00770 [Desulfuromonadaceae bacterium GWB2_53_15]|nr:MAG: hypothetical protein A2X79_00770 [Desulfuromonadaceae bacterium GWB2_53_15]
MIISDRYDRNIRLFGAEGQQKLRETVVTLIGAGGLGSAICQHLALLGVGKIFVIEDESLDNTNRNRFIGARADDPIPGTHKLDVIKRLVRETNPDVAFTGIPYCLFTIEAFSAIRESNWVIGCLDHDGPRAVLAEVCAAYAKPYIDAASDVPEAGVYGGRICITNGDGCLFCLNQLDSADIRRFLATDEEQRNEAAIYGVPIGALGESGPAVSPINGVVASLAAMEFMVAVTGLRAPTRLLEYRGHTSKVLVGTDMPKPDCFYCKGTWGIGAEADVERYLRMPHLRQRRENA